MLKDKSQAWKDNSIKIKWKRMTTNINGSNYRKTFFKIDQNELEKEE